MTELKKLTIEIIKKHLATNKKITYEWDRDDSYYVINTGCFSTVHIGKEKVIFHTVFSAIPVYGDFTEIWQEACELENTQTKIKKDNREARIIRWLKMQK